MYCLPINMWKWYEFCHSAPCPMHGGIILLAMIKGRSLWCYREQNKRQSRSFYLECTLDISKSQTTMPIPYNKNYDGSFYTLLKGCLRLPAWRFSNEWHNMTPSMYRILDILQSYNKMAYGTMKESKKGLALKCFLLMLDWTSSWTNKLPLLKYHGTQVTALWLVFHNMIQCATHK